MQLKANNYLPEIWTPNRLVIGDGLASSLCSDVDLRRRSLAPSSAFFCLIPISRLRPWSVRIAYITQQFHYSIATQSQSFPVTLIRLSKACTRRWRVMLEWTRMQTDWLTCLAKTFQDSKIWYREQSPHNTDVLLVVQTSFYYIFTCSCTKLNILH